MSDDLRFGTMQGALRSLSRVANEGRQLADGIEQLAKDEADARWAWKRYLAVVAGSSTASSADKREAEAIASDEGGPLYQAHLTTEARLKAVTERLRWARAAVTGAVTAVATHRAEAEALNVEHGLADEPQ